MKNFILTALAFLASTAGATGFFSFEGMVVSATPDRVKLEISPQEQLLLKKERFPKETDWRPGNKLNVQLTKEEYEKARIVVKPSKK